MNTHLSIQDFQQALASFPDTPRLIQHNGVIQTAPIAESSESVKENKAILADLQRALISEYGATIAQFVFPVIDPEVGLEENFPLTPFLLKKFLRKAKNLKESLARYEATFPLPESASPEECQAYLNTVATYSKQEAEGVAQAVTDKSTATAVTITLTDDLMTSLFSATSATTLEQLGNYITAHPSAVPSAIAAAFGVEPHPLAIGAFGLTSVIMHSSSNGSVAVALSEELARVAST